MTAETKTDRKLLELAAKAEGVVRWSDAYEGWRVDVDGIQSRAWSPLTDDGDALRLAVALGIGVRHRQRDTNSTYPAVIRVFTDSFDLSEFALQDPYAATRRAIVRAAAAIGEQMP